MPYLALAFASMIVCFYSTGIVTVTRILRFQRDLTIGMYVGADQLISFGPPLPLLLKIFPFSRLCFMSAGVNCQQDLAMFTV